MTRPSLMTGVPDLNLPATPKRRMVGRRRAPTSALKATVFMLALSSAAFGQEYSVHSYSTREGLPNNLTKYALQDEQGFVWIATDGGAVRFDGVSFKVFTTADGLPSNYVKSLFSDGTGREYIVTDLGIVRIVKDPLGVRFEPFAEGRTIPSDSLLFYPKEMYQDRSGRVWITDARGVARVHNSSIRKYLLPTETWPDSFVRTYQMMEDERGRLLLVAERGQMYLFDEHADRFWPLKTPEGLHQSSALLPRPDGSFWLGNATGLYSFRIDELDEVVEWQRITDLEQVLLLLDGGNGRVFVGTATSGVHVLTEADGYSNARPFVNLDSDVINHMMIDYEGNLFISTDNGFAIARPNFFINDALKTNTAIQSIATDPHGSVYSISEMDLYRLRYESRRMSRVKLFTADEGLTALASDGKRHWAGSRNSSIYLLHDGHLQKFDLRGHQAVTSMATDGVGSLWAASFKRTEIANVTPDGGIKYYGPEKGVLCSVNVIRVIDGDIYVGGDGEAYLLKFVPALDRFVDISLPLGFEPHSELEINDLHIGADGNFWLASNQGLLVVGTARLDRYPSPILESEEIRSISYDSFGSTWVGTGRGLFRLNDGQISHFNRDRGLTNLTMNHRSLVVDADQRPWVGHYSGVSVWARRVGEMLMTPRPISLGLSVDGIPAEPDIREIPYGVHLKLQFVALSFPGDHIRYQTRSSRAGGEWSPPSSQSFLDLYQVPEGEHVVEVRAQQDGYVWSEPTEIAFNVGLPWYREGWAVIVYFVGGFGVLFLIMTIHDRVRTGQLRERNEKLETLVKKRTRELIDQTKTIEQTNMELKEALEQNHEFVGIAAHDLRNPLTSLIGFSELLLDSTDRMDDGEFKSKSRDILPIIHRAASSMQGVIQDVLDSQMVDRGANKLNIEDVDITEIARTVINLNSAAARRKGITIHFNPKGIYHARCDARGIQRVLDNLLSNAIKYSPPSSTVFVSLSFVDGALRAGVRDEGPGLTAEDRRRVFGKLQRLSAKPTGGENSTGLGLYIVRSIIEMHDGQVGVDSEPGEGAEFWIEVPVEQARAAA